MPAEAAVGAWIVGVWEAVSVVDGESAADAAGGGTTIGFASRCAAISVSRSLMISGASSAASAGPKITSSCRRNIISGPGGSVRGGWSAAGAGAAECGRDGTGASGTTGSRGETMCRRRGW
eukprot:1393730-Amorphochlora_amoeboformis.AAC.2